MSPAFYQTQVQRLITRFGQKNFDPEFCKLIWGEVHDMSEPGFRRLVDVFIGSRSPNKPPLLSEFREARIQESKIKFDNETKEAAKMLNRLAPPEMKAQLRDTLSKEFGAVDNVIDALEIAKLRLHLKRTDNPDGAA